MSRPGEQPVSFKTVPGRNKTQKWQQAKSYNYDGDEWGALDEFDEYGGYDDTPAPPPALQQRYASEPPMEQRRPNRQNSFDAGIESERRQFSGPAGFAQQERRGSPAVSSSSGSRPSQDYARGPVMEHERRRERNFTNPEHVPPPLSMRGAPPPTQGPPGDSHAFPPRKSSISSQSGSAPAIPAAETMPTAKSPSTDKPLPFIRPSDIYKRIEEEKEKERASMDSSRPSMDSLQRMTSPPQGRSAADSPASAGIGRRPSMEPVSEEREPPSVPLPALPSVEEQRGSREVAAEESPEIEGRGSQLPEYRPLSSLGPSGFGEPADADKKTSPVLPPVSRISGFGSEFLHGYTDSSSNTAEEENNTPTSPQQHMESTISRVMNAPVVNTGAANTTSFSSIQGTPTTMGRESDRSTDGLDENQAPTSELQHHGSDASQGFRSVVNTAFDRKDDSSVPPTPTTRDESQDDSDAVGVGRSDTTSTAGISPIMSRVPSAATDQKQQQERDTQVPPIAEESTPTQSRPASAAFGTIPRKPTPGGHSRDGSGSSIVQPGYRRSLDPPSHGSSPSRTPGFETVETRRLSGPMSAVTVNDPEAPDVSDQAAEVPDAHLEPAETPASEISQPADQPLEMPKPLPTTGRGRSGTDYSMREADMAHNINASPDAPSYSPPIAQDAQINQREFLRNHASNPGSPISVGGFGRPVSPNIAAAGLGIARSTTPGSMAGVGPNSPVKGRVREIAGNYNNLDEASRRNSNASSKSSWSNFGRSEENLALKRKGTGLSQRESGDGEEAVQDGDEMFPRYGQSQDGNEGHPAAPSDASLNVPRPGIDSQQSFRPHLPGEWVSYAPTPANEEPPGQDEIDASRDALQPAALTPRASKVPDEPVDLTPTTRKSALQIGDIIPTPGEEKPNTFNQVRDAGAALGASLMTAAGLTSQARDFGSTEPVVPVEQPEMRAKAPSGAISGYLKPQFARQESEATSVATSAASSVPPTPPAKDTPIVPADGQDAAPVNKNLTGLDDVGPEGRPISGYFSGADPPLRTDHSRERSKDTPEAMQAERPHFNQSLSTNTAADDFESDRLRKEIVRSLDPIQNGEVDRNDVVKDAERTQDALDAPDNARRVEDGVAPDPPAETQSKPMLLNQRFSWEQAPTLASTAEVPQHQPKPHYPITLAPGEIAPEAPYERPRSRGLHIMNADSDNEETPVEEQKPALTQQNLPANDSLAGIVSPIAASQENLGASVTSSQAGGGMQHVEPSPVGDKLGLETPDSPGVRFPSYYQSDAARSTMIPQSPPLNVPQTPTPDERLEEKASPQQETSTPSTTTAKRQSNSRIPPFREILSIKDTGDRIKTYNDTRQTFATMDTGLQSWLSNMLEKHPEHANLSTQSTFPAPAVGARVGGHRHSPSIMKMGSSFGGGSDRKASIGGNPESLNREGGLDMEKVGQRGKELMNKAGKGMMAGGKGLFAKGKSRFGTLKGRDGGAGGGGGQAPSSPSSSSRAAAAAASSPRAAPPSSSSAVVPPLSPLQQPSAATAFPPAAAPPDAREESFVPPSSAANEDAATAVAEKVGGGVDTPVRALSPVSKAASVRTETRPGSSSAGVGHRHGLSQAFERLRERGRNKQSRSRSSRPGSRVLDSGSEEERRSSSPSRSVGLSRVSTGLSLSGLGRGEAWNASSVAGGVGGGRVEAWNLPDAEIPGKLDEGGRSSGVRYDGVGFGGEGEGEERLGVLPSPAAEEFAEFMTIGGGKLVPQGREGEDGAGGVTDVQQEAPVEDKVQPLLIRKLRSGSEATDPPQAGTIESQRSVSTPVRPLHERKHSALAELPSQQRVRQLSSPVKAGELPFASPTGDEDDELYNRTPVATKPASLPFIAKHAVEDEDDLYNSTPMATKAADVPWRSEGERPTQDVSAQAEHSREPQASAGAEASMLPSYESTFVTPSVNASRPVSRLDIGGIEADRMSAVSAEDRTGNIHDKKGPEDFGPADSRRSSVSSIGSPDTVVGNRASMIVVQQQENTAKARAPDGNGRAAGKPSIVQQIMQPSIERPANAPTAEQLFMNRTYRGRAAGQSTERPMSFVPASVNASQDQDMLDTVEEGEGTGTYIPVDVSALGGPPAGTPPFMQHPVYRNSMATVQPTEYEKLRTSPVGIPDQALSAGHSRQPSQTNEKRRSSRLSGFFGKKQEANKGNAPYTTLPTPSAVNDQSGMRNGSGVGDMTPGSEVPPDVSERDANNAKRRSGFWDTIRPSSTASRTNFSNRSSAGRVSPSKATPPATSSNAPDIVAPLPTRARGLLKKPQRSASTATPPTESTKQGKRFSGLGRIFGRSNTQGHNTPKSNKLTKLQQLQPSSRESSIRRGHVGRVDDAGGQTGDRAAYEARRSQQVPGVQTRHEHSPGADISFEQPPADLDERGIPVPPKAEQDGVVTAPPQGWYAPGQDEDEPVMSPTVGPLDQDQFMQQPSGDDRMMSPTMRPFPAGQQPARGPNLSTQAQERPVQFRRLHSESFRRGLQQAQIPEAFQPVEASYGIQAKPIGPPSQFEPPVIYQPRTVRDPAQDQQPSRQSRQPTLPTGQPYWGQAPPQPFAPGHRQLPWGSPRERQYSAVSAVSAGSQLSPQVSRGLDQPVEWTGGSSHAVISPMHSRQGSETGMQPQLPLLQTERSRMGSLDQEVARSPAKEYADQQTPYAISLPGGASPPDSRVPSWNSPPDNAPPRVLSQDQADPQYSEGGHYRIQQGPPAQYDWGYNPAHLQQQSSYPPVSTVNHPSLPRRQQYTMGSPETPGYGRPQVQHPAIEAQRYALPPYTPPAGVDHQQPYQTYLAHPQQQQLFQNYPQQQQQQQDSYDQYQQRQQASYDLPPQAPPPASQQRPWVPPHARAPDAHRPPPPHMRQRYYSSGGSASEGRPLTYQRTTSGYSGRRDDAAVNEQEVDAIMRGASYPGQEWAPRVCE